ncbi:hypothetical protein SAMN06295905_0919 [Devosia lucknowensis]|uniref:Uncharacterized protein n=1 Tax=Devosia lucknowensis TaxID=1096929 RepID=A0A1Y6ET41_9HYPH|nr:hypothetical protein [Devosia lucknowensis]SMQ64120.1 hypothetical protein SAMN06295905_0919 [Devosia lucknowensis]
MRAEQPGIAYQSVEVGSAPVGYWPIAGFESIAYRLANLRISRFGALMGVSLLFYLA